MDLLLPSVVGLVVTDPVLRPHSYLVLQQTKLEINEDNDKNDDDERDHCKHNDFYLSLGDLNGFGTPQIFYGTKMIIKLIHLQTLETRCRGEVVPEVHEVQGSHRLQDQDLGKLCVSSF